MPFNSLAYALLLAVSTAWMAVGAWPAWLLIAASLLFYAVAGPFDSAVFLGAVTLNWLIQIWVPAGKWRIAAAVMLNIGLIGAFKYADFLLGRVGRSGSYIDTALPLGISFYSLQALAYHIEVARGRADGARSFPEFFLFKAFFPQLVAGPIVRVWQLLPQLQRLFEGIRIRRSLTVFGLGLIALGLFKKVALADSLAPIVDEIFSAPPGNASRAWLGAVLFTFQIYFDFSGYSDIAIGSAYLLGIRLPQNFAAPLLATSIREFWQRWHMTLSQFLRDYVFFPLADLRLVARRWRLVQHLVAMVLTMALCGLWHGAGWTFIIWGTLHGLALVVALLWARWLPPLPNLIGRLATFTFLAASLVIFRSPGVDYSLDYLATMFAFRTGLPAMVDDAAPMWQVAAGIALLFALHSGEAWLQRPRFLYVLRRINGPVSHGFLVAVALLLILIPSTNVNPFIYFRF